MTHATPLNPDARLRAAAAELRLPLSDAQRAQLLEFLAQMQRWNRTYNLTALRNPQQMLVQHVFDALAVVAPLAQVLSNTLTDPVANPDADSTTPKILDVGSGGGVPGVVLAVARPDWRVVCVDAVEKKTAFVRQVAAVLGLSNLTAQHARVETLPAQESDIVISRAFASLADFAVLAGHHAKPGATLAAMKGALPETEIAALNNANDTPWRVVNPQRDVQRLTVPELAAQRCLIWLRRATIHTSSPH